MPVTFNTGTNTTVQSGPWNLSTADLNGDGKADLVVANTSSNSVSVLLGNGNGSFQPVANYLTGVNPLSVALTDVTGDGKLDIVVGQQGRLQYLTGNGDGTFQTTATTITNSLTNSYWVRAADLDGDGKSDLVYSTYTGNQVSVQYGNGDGTFTNPIFDTVSALSRDLTIADFNGDGKLDIAISGGAGSNTVSVFLANGTRNFAAAQTFTVGSFPYAVATGDFNRDGKLDLVTANASGSYSLLLGNGMGGFGTATTTTVSGNPNEVSVADINGDGKLDLIFALLNNTVGVVLGNGDGTFQAMQTLTAGINTYDAIAVDLNGDGRLDLAVTNQGSATVTTFLQPTPAPTPNTGDSGYTFTTNATGGHDITLTNPSTLNSGLGTPYVDNVIYGVNQPLRLPDNIENIVLSGQGSGFPITGNALDNTFTINAGSWAIDGVAGNDTVRFGTTRAAHSVVQNPDGSLTITGPEGTEQISHVQTITFSDARIALDTSANAMEIARLYDAALHRQADIAGANAFVGALNAGATPLALAQSLLTSAEGQRIYAPTLSNHDFVTALYANVLGRAPDTGGQAAYEAALNGGASRASVLLSFADSPEHQAHIGVVGQGVIHDIPLA